MPTFGAYKSVNNLPHFADAVKEHGPYDPEVKVAIGLARDGRYTIDSVDAFDAAMKPKFGLDLTYFINNTINGVIYVSNGQIQVDVEGMRYTFYISDAGGQILPYSILSIDPTDYSSYRVTQIYLPSDHPFLQAFVSV